MSRNYKKNRNIAMPLGRNSAVLRALIEDAEECNMSHQIGVFASIRLAEYYKARRQGRILPEGAGYPASYPPVQPWAAPSSASPPSRNDNGNGHYSLQQSASELERLKNRPEVVQAADADDVEASDLAFFIDDEEEEGA
ncbi:MAG: hypothetical protein M3Y39_20170 [Chloroflexota bacterium]|nr:hypothetical protein [Chloroflexota bacterium]